MNENCATQHRDSGLPTIPPANRYAGHEAVISRIAKDIVDGIFSHYKPVPLKPVSVKEQVVATVLTVRVTKEDIYVFRPKTYGHRLYYTDYGMRSIPDINMFSFAINPFIKYYAEKQAEETFGRLPVGSMYELKIGFCKDTDKSTGKKVQYPCIELNQYLLPSKSLNSW